MNHNENLMKWDKYFFNICTAIAANSSCLSRHIGAILVRDKTIISQGYNGPPRGIKHCNDRYLIDSEMRRYLESKGIDPTDERLHTKCPRYVMGYKSGQGLQHCIAGHAERNALINAARHGIKTKGCQLFMDCGVPCTPCTIEIINAGIKEIIVSKMTFYDTSAKYLLENADLKIRLYSHLCEHKNVIPTSILKEKIDGVCPDCGIHLGE